MLSPIYVYYIPTKEGASIRRRGDGGAWTRHLHVLYAIIYNMSIKDCMAIIIFLVSLVGDGVNGGVLPVQGKGI
jgi:hypothetical protein